nr:FAD-dependent oxidoreductase [uncultured Marvinbryantia sp.]
MDRERFYDVIVIGGGPAGLTAALYLSRACYRTLVIEKEQFGGQITITEEVVNYPGVNKTSGRALTETMRKQAEGFGAEFLLAEVTEVFLDEDIKEIRTEKGTYSCFGVVLATGAHPRMVGFPGEAEFRGRGVAYCATCDGEFFTGKEVFVVGGGFVAAEESVFLTKYASHVTILIRGEDFSCAEAVAQAARNHPKITVRTNTQVLEVTGENALRSIRYQNTKTGEESVFAPEGDTFGVFVFAGYAPDTELVKGKIELDERGYVCTDRNRKTNLPGVYAAGDVCQKNLRQVVTAVGDGATAATELEKYASVMQEKTGIRPQRPSKKDNGQTGVQAEGNGKAETAQAAEEQQRSGGLFPKEMLAQLSTVFTRMEAPLILSLHLDERPVSQELKYYMEELAKQTDKLSVSLSEEGGSHLPFVEVLRGDGTKTGLRFHGVPGGHEFTSFVLGLYNAAGPGQPLDEETKQSIRKLDVPVRMQIFVSLSCTMCPELVTAAQRIASLNPDVEAEVYDLNHFPELKEQYHVMSVPCLVLNEEKTLFGKKKISRLLEEIKNMGSPDFARR